MKRFYALITTIVLLLWGLGIQPSALASQDVVRKHRQTQEKIKKLKWLENVETNKLYKNQQKLENAKMTLQTSKSKLETTQNELVDMQYKLFRAVNEYNELNTTLQSHIRNIYKIKRRAICELLLNAGDINILVDRLYFQKIILKNDFEQMAEAKRKAHEIAVLKTTIELRKRNLEQQKRSAESQKIYIQSAIDKNEAMINKLRTDRAYYEKAERELARQSASIGSYINRTGSSGVKVASGFIKPIGGPITSPFGTRVHPIFKSTSFHSGIDIGGPNLGAIRASNSGKVIYSGWYGGYGKVVILEHGIVNGKPMTTLYAHMNTIKVSNGQYVTKGQIIGLEGTTGYSTGPHCHFEVRVNGQPNNPVNYVGR